MKQLDAKIWLLLVLVVPLCGNTCTFHSGSNHGGTRLVVCVPASPLCLDSDTRRPPEDTENDSGASATAVAVAGPNGAVSQSAAPSGRATGAAMPSYADASTQLDQGTPEFENQFTALGVATLREPVPTLGPSSIAILGALLGATAFWWLRAATDSAS